ncbi:MAG: lipoate--protein ligase [Bacteroidota bacterium]
MLCVYNPSTDPYFNLAAEEYFLRERKEDLFMLWRNEPSVIIGKHQNGLAEINMDFVRKNGVKVVRRLSGGGTVFHDLGNLNFTFVSTGQSNQLVDFRKYTLPILEVLRDKMGIDALFEGRNDLTIKGMKFSGNAEHVFKDRVLHHGTLLFSSVMTDLSAALNVDPAKFQDKAVKSVRSRVTNISEHLTKPISIIEFTQMIMAHIIENNDSIEVYELTKSDSARITDLRDSRYATWEWNFGYSPRYTLQKKVKTSGGMIEFDLDVDKGKIRDLQIFGDYFNTLDVSDVVEALKGVNHEEASIVYALVNIDIGLYFTGVTKEEFVAGLF